MPQPGYIKIKDGSCAHYLNSFLANIEIQNREKHTDFKPENQVLV